MAIAFLYPGQSTQKAGLGKGLYEQEPLAREFFDAADGFLGFPLSRLCFQGPEELLNDDLNCQLAMYTHSCAVTAMLQDRGIGADVLSGYSSGFYAAAYGAGCFDFLTGLGIVRKAGELLMACKAETDGAMGVIFGLDPDEVTALCDHIGGVQAAIFNTPRQIIISGIADRVDAAMEKAMAQGALDAYRLPAATAYHCSLMKPAGDALITAVEAKLLNPPKTELISYSTLQPVAGAQDLVNTMAMQLSNPVRWTALIRLLRQQAVETAYEVGPGRVITRSVRWIDRNLSVLPIEDADDLAAVIEHAKNNPSNKKQ